MRLSTSPPAAPLPCLHPPLPPPPPPPLPPPSPHTPSLHTPFTPPLRSSAPPAPTCTALLSRSLRHFLLAALRSDTMCRNSCCRRALSCNGRGGGGKGVRVCLICGGQLRALSNADLHPQCRLASSMQPACPRPQPQTQPKPKLPTTHSPHHHSPRFHLPSSPPCPLPSSTLFPKSPPPHLSPPPGAHLAPEQPEEQRQHSHGVNLHVCGGLHS